MTVVVAAATLGPAPAAKADSVFSSVGFGRWTYTTDARSAAMGDVSIVGASRFAFSPRNPAMMAYLDRAAGYASVVSAFTRVTAGAGTETRPDATIPLLGVGVPVGAGIVASGFLHQLTDARYAISQEVDGTPGYTLRTEGEGGWTQAGLNVARAFGPVALGVQLGLPFTAIDETIVRDFADDTEFADREEQLETDINDAPIFTLGAHSRVGPAEAGAFFQLPTTATIATRHEAGGVVTGSSFELGIPAAFGVGLAYTIPGGVTLAGEYRRQPWERVEIDGESWRALPPAERTRVYVDRNAWGVGVEWQPEGRTARDHPLVWRVGYAYQPWVVSGPTFGHVTDRSITAGFGIPFREGNGELDITFRYTFRRERDSDLEENVFGIVLGLAFARQPREF